MRREILNKFFNLKKIVNDTCNELKIQLCAKDIALESNISFCENKRA